MTLQNSIRTFRLSVLTLAAAGMLAYLGSLPGNMGESSSMGGGEISAPSARAKGCHGRIGMSKENAIVMGGNFTCMMWLP